MRPPTTQFDWSDLKYLLAVARHGGTLGAGRTLEVNPSTVQRRLGELERCFGQPLVERHSTGYRLTEFGERLLPHAERVEQAVLDLAQQADALRRDLTGVVRVTCPDSVVYRITHSPLLERFQARYPGIKVEFVLSDTHLDLRQGEADIALRAGVGDDTLVGRKIADSPWAIYASQKYLERHGRPDAVADLARHALVGLDETRADHKMSQWLRQVAPGATLVARSDNVLGLMYSVKSGVGLAPLPVALAAPEADLVQVLGPIRELEQVWRILTTRELRQTPRVAALFDFLIEEIETLRSVMP